MIILFSDYLKTKQIAVMLRFYVKFLFLHLPDVLIAYTVNGFISRTLSVLTWKSSI